MPAKERQPLRCHGCGNEMPREHGKGLHHGPKCERLHKTKIAGALKRLKKAGFAQNAKIPNVWTKASVSVTLEQVLHEGFEETIKKHSSALSAHSGNAAGKAKRRAGKKTGAKQGPAHSRSKNRA